jgi:hypothetical protein
MLWLLLRRGSGVNGVIQPSIPGRQAKRVITEIAPGVRVLLDAYMKAYNEAPVRVSPPEIYGHCQLGAGCIPTPQTQPP